MCRKEKPFKVNLFAKYRRKGFEIWVRGSGGQKGGKQFENQSGSTTEHPSEVGDHGFMGLPIYPGV